MVEDIFEVDSKGQATRVLQGELSDPAVETRESAIIGILHALAVLQPSYVLREEWRDKLETKLDSTIQRAQEYREPFALIVPYTDVPVNIPRSATFVNEFLKLFGAHVYFGNGKKLEVTVDTIPRILKASSFDIRTLSTRHPNNPGRAWKVLRATPVINNQDWIRAGESSFLQTEGHELIVSTKIPGVMLALDGSLISGPNTVIQTLRPMLLVSLLP